MVNLNRMLGFERGEEIRAGGLAVSKEGEYCPKLYDSANLELLFSSFTLVIHTTPILVKQNVTKDSS